MISVITIFLNEATFLPEAIDSVLAQSLTDWELLLVDDGSTDGSSEIARRYAQQHPGKVIYLDHPYHANQGMSASRNLGLRHARGRYVAYLDADDVWLPHKLADQVAILDARPEVAMVYGPVQCWYSWTGMPDDRSRDFTYGLLDHGFRLAPGRLLGPPEWLCLILRYESLVPTPSSVMARTDALHRVGGSERRFRSAYEDCVLYLKIARTESVFVLPAYQTRYRIHPQSAARTAAREGTMEADRLYFLDWADEYLRTCGESRDAVWEAMRAARWQARHPRAHRLRQAARQFTARGIDTGRRWLTGRSVAVPQ